MFAIRDEAERLDSLACTINAAVETKQHLILFQRHLLRFGLHAIAQYLLYSSAIFCFENYAADLYDLCSYYLRIVGVHNTAAYCAGAEAVSSTVDRLFDRV